MGRRLARCGQVDCPMRAVRLPVMAYRLLAFWKHASAARPSGCLMRGVALTGWDRQADRQEGGPKQRYLKLSSCRKEEYPKGEVVGENIKY